MRIWLVNCFIARLQIVPASKIMLPRPLHSGYFFRLYYDKACYYIFLEFYMIIEGNYLFY